MGNDSSLNFSFNDFNTNLQNFQSGLTDAELGVEAKPIRDTISIGIAGPNTNTYMKIKNGHLVDGFIAPSLSPPGESVPGGIDHAAKMVRNYPDQILGFLNNFPTDPEDTYPDDFDAEIAAVGQETLKQLGNGDAKKGALMVRFAALHPDASGVSKELAAVGASVREKTDQKAGHGPSATLIAIEDAAINALAEWNFQELVESMPNTSDSDKKALYFAHNVRSAIANLSPLLQAKLKQAEGLAHLRTQNESGIPAGWLTGPDTKGYEAKLGSEYASKVIGTLEKQVLDGKLTRAQYNEMRTLLFHPDFETPNKATLLPMLKEIAGQVIQGMQKDYEFPTGYSFKINEAGYDAILNGTFSRAFNQQIDDSSLSTEQKNILKAALLSSDAAEALPPDLKAIFDKAMTAGIQKVGRMYGVPNTWVPDSKVLTIMAKNANNPKIISVQIGINQANEWLSTGKKAIAIIEASGQGGPTLVLIKEYMKTVSLALAGMQEMLYELSITDANMADISNKVQNDDKLGELRRQASDLKEVIDKQKKAESMGPLKAIFQWIIMLILVMFLGPIGLMIAMTLMVSSIVQAVKSVAKGKDPGKAFMDMSFIDDLGKTLADIGKAIGGPGGEAFARAMTVIIMVMMVVVCPTLLVCDLMIGDGDIIKNVLMALGVPKKDAEMAAMIIQIVVQVVVAVVLAIVTGGASIMASVAQIGKAIGQLTLSIIKTVLRNAVQMAIRFLSKIIEQICKTLGTKAPVITAKSINTALDQVEKVVKAFVDSCKDTITKLEKVENLEKAVDVAKKDVTTATKVLEAKTGTSGEAAANDALKEAKKVLDTAQKSLETEVDAAEKAANEMLENVEKITTGMDVVKAVTDAVPQIQNNILQAMITRIRAAMDAAMVLIEQFVKLIKDLVKKLMDMVSACASDIKDIGESQQKMFSNASQTIAHIFQG